MIGVCLDELSGKERMTEALHKLARTHAQKGVVSNEYFLVGEVLLWTFTQCLGPQFDNVTTTAWVRIYSMMLSEIIPVAVCEEDSLSLSAAHAQPTHTS